MGGRVPGSLQDAIRVIVDAAKRDGSTIYTDEAVKRLRADHPDVSFSSASITDAVIRAACDEGVPVRMEVPLEVL